MKRFTTLIMVMIITAIMVTSCGDEKRTSSTQRSRRNDSTLTEQTLVEEIITEDIVVEEIEVHEIEVNEIGWDSDNVTRWD